MCESGAKLTKLPLSLKIAAVYLILKAVGGIVLELAVPKALLDQSTSTNMMSQVGMYATEFPLVIACLVSGVGILCRKNWARRLALVILILEIPFAVEAFAWGRAGGNPSPSGYLLSFIFVALWNGFWFYLIFRGGKRGHH